MKYIAFLIFLNLSVGLISAQTSNKLDVRVSKSYIHAGDYYYMYVKTNKKADINYSGRLEAETINCTPGNPQSCQTRVQSPWGEAVVDNGVVRIDVPQNWPAQTYKSRYRPYQSDWEWSGWIYRGVETIEGLEDANQYWVPLTTPAYYQGFNYKYQTAFRTAIGHLPPTDVCGHPGQIMYFMKNNPHGYWGGGSPWFEGSSTNNTTNNLLWYNRLFLRLPNWHDEYLTSYGWESFTYNLNDPFNFAANFQAKTRQVITSSINAEFPGYILSPRYVSSGWTIVNKTSWGGGKSSDFTQSICDIPLDPIPQPPPTTAGGWKVEAELLDITIPGYIGPALKFRYYEGDPNLFTDPTKWGIIEDWYFVKNIGLVRIDGKMVGPRFPSQYVTLVPCQEDPDCLATGPMTQPHVTLTRETVNNVSGDLNNDGHVNLIDLSSAISSLNITSYNQVVANYGK